MDVHVKQAVADGLRQRGVDVLTAQQDGMTWLIDSDLLDRATSLSRVLFSQDDDLLREATERQRNGVPFAGVVYAHQLAITVGRTMRDLELLAQVYEPEDIANRVEYLPL
jgi:hypothetical protein